MIVHQRALQGDGVVCGEQFDDGFFSAPKGDSSINCPRCLTRTGDGAKVIARALELAATARGEADEARENAPSTIEEIIEHLTEVSDELDDHMKKRYRSDLMRASAHVRQAIADLSDEDRS